METNDHLTKPSAMKMYKIVLLGNVGVGKTSIIHQFIYRENLGKLSINILSKMMYIDAKTFRLLIWDMPGHERFSTLLSGYIKNCSVVIIVFDISQHSSFINLEKWVQAIRNEQGDDALIIIVGNKIDLLNKRVVSPEECQAKAASLNAHYQEVSAKTSFTTNQLFQYLLLILNLSIINPHISYTTRVKSFLFHCLS